MKLGGSHVREAQGESEREGELDMTKVQCMYMHKDFSKGKLKTLFVLHKLFCLATRRQHWKEDDEI